MRLSKDRYFLELLKLVAERSTCGRRKVGAIITDAQGHVLSTGYNGVPSGVVHCIDVPCAGRDDSPGDSSRCMAVHAEQNALLQCSQLQSAHTIYVTCSPCFVCMKMLANTHIARIVCVETYTDQVGISLWTLSQQLGGLGREMIVVKSAS